MTTTDVKNVVSVTTKLTKKTKGTVDVKDDELEVAHEDANEKDESDEDAASQKEHNDIDGFVKKQQVNFDDESEMAESVRDHSDSIDI